MSSNPGSEGPENGGLNPWLKIDYDSSDYTFIYDELPPQSGQDSGMMAVNHLIPSGSRGKLGEALEKMHNGVVLSQHEKAAALRDYNQLMSNLAELKEKTKHTNLVLSENAALEEEKKRKDKLITDYQKRFQRKSHNTKTNALQHVHVEDLVPPEKIIDNFVDLYKKEWFQAFKTLNKSWHDEERTIFSLFRVVRIAYVFCSDMVEYQRTAMEDLSARMQEVMLTPTFIHPVSKLKYKPFVEMSTETQHALEAGNRRLEDYKNLLCSHAAAAVMELFREVKLPELFDSGFVSEAVKDFVYQTVELIWRMVIQDPPMVLYWLEPKQTVEKHYFKFYKETGSLVRQTVWPAVFHKDGGALLSKGLVLAGSEEEFEG